MRLRSTELQSNQTNTAVKLPYTLCLWITYCMSLVNHQSISFFWLAEKSHQKSLQRVLKVNTIHTQTHLSMRHNKNPSPDTHRHAYILPHIHRHTNLHNKTNCGFPASVDTPPSSTTNTHSIIYTVRTYSHTHTRTNTHIIPEMHCSSNAHTPTSKPPMKGMQCWAHVSIWVH